MQFLLSIVISFLFSRKSVLLKETLFHGDREGRLKVKIEYIKFLNISCGRQIEYVHLCISGNIEDD